MTMTIKVKRHKMREWIERETKVLLIEMLIREKGVKKMRFFHSKRFSYFDLRVSAEGLLLILVSPTQTLLLLFLPLCTLSLSLSLCLRNWRRRSRRENRQKGIKRIKEKILGTDRVAKKRNTLFSFLSYEGLNNENESEAERSRGEDRTRRRRTEQNWKQDSFCNRLSLQLRLKCFSLIVTLSLPLVSSILFSCIFDAWLSLSWSVVWVAKTFSQRISTFVWLHVSHVRHILCFHLSSPSFRFLSNIQEKKSSSKMLKYQNKSLICFQTSFRFPFCFWKKWVIHSILKSQVSFSKIAAQQYITLSFKMERFFWVPWCFSGWLFVFSFRSKHFLFCDFFFTQKAGLFCDR